MTPDAISRGRGEEGQKRGLGLWWKEEEEEEEEVEEEEKESGVPLMQRLHGKGRTAGKNSDSTLHNSISRSGLGILV